MKWRISLSAIVRAKSMKTNLKKQFFEEVGVWSFHFHEEGASGNAMAFVVLYLCSDCCGSMAIISSICMDNFKKN